MSVTKIIQILVLVNCVLAWSSLENKECGYESCHPTKEGFINVHIVPHSHDDVGWKKTVDEYYYGLKDYIQVAGVQYIIGSVVEALREDSNRRFIQVETAFFWKWYSSQNKQTRMIVKDHVRRGKLEFVGGGWSMNDEATTHYQAIIDQFTWGLKKLNETFGECGHPKVGWQIDPFGHSRETAAIFAQMGYDAFIFARTDFQERKLREASGTNQMIWKSNPTLGTNYDIFTSILYNDAYSSPSWFCFDEICGDPPMIDDAKSPIYNVDSKIDLFIKEIETRAAVSATKHIIIPLGGDFTMQNAYRTFLNIDKLIRYANLRQENGSLYNLLYSTPSCYVKAIYDDTKGKRGFPVKTDDFLPYGTGEKAYWTGFYTSRPTLKRNAREANSFLQVLKQLQALTLIKNDRRIDELKSVLGILQHHDAITGTEKQDVADDYTRMLFTAIEESLEVVSNTLNNLTETNSPTNFTTCLLANISQCALTEKSKTFVVTVYNPLSRTVNKYVRLPVTGTNYIVTGPRGNNIPLQLLPIPTQVLNIPGRESDALYDLVFLAENIPPLGFKSYFVQEIAGDIVTKRNAVNNINFQNLQVNIDPDTGLLNLINFANIELPVSQRFEEYFGVNYLGNTNEKRNSGAYVFNPREPSQNITNDRVSYTVYEGNLVKEIHQTFGDYVSQIIRIYSKENFVEFNWLVGPLPLMDVGREIISVFETNLDTNATFYTETNGKQLMKRIKDYRPSYDFNLSHSIAANYYPVTSKIVLKDEMANVQFTVINDRTQGGTSLRDGKVELMIHRACLADDDLGVDEDLKEYAFGEGLVVRGSHYVVAGFKNSSENSIAALEIDITQRKVMDAMSFLSTTNSTSFEKYAEENVMEFSGLTHSLPKNVQILTLEPWKDLSNQILFRLEHVFNSDDDSQLGVPISVNMQNLFETFNILKIEETTLGANQWLKESKRLDFDIHDSPESDVNLDHNLDTKENFENVNLSDTLEDDLDNLIVVLNPTEIRTFIITTKLIPTW